MTITAITGDNGIIKQAQDAAEATEKAQAIEKVEMAIMQSFGKDGEIDKDKLIENLQDVDGIDPSTIPSDSDFDFPLTIVVDDYEVVIEENGDVHIEGEEGGNTNTRQVEIQAMAEILTQVETMAQVAETPIQIQEAILILVEITELAEAILVAMDNEAGGE